MKNKVYKQLVMMMVIGSLVSSGIAVSAADSASTESVVEALQEIPEAADTEEETTTTEIVTADSVTDEAVTEEMINFKDSDNYDESVIHEATASVECDGSIVNIAGEGVTADGSNLVISEEGIYVFSGELTDGTITIEADEKADVTIVLNGFTMTSQDAAIVALTADTVTISTVAGTENSIADGSNRENEEYDAAIYSETDLVMNGEGTLSISGNYKDAVHTKDDLRITSGNYVVEAADDGFVGKDRLEILNGSFKLHVSGDGFKSTKEEDEEKGFIYIQDGDFDVTTGDEAFQAARNMQVDGGTYTISAEGKGMSAGHQLQINAGTITIEQSYEGLEAPILVINDGVIDITASDDGINAAGGGKEGTSDTMSADFDPGTMQMPSDGDAPTDMSTPLSDGDAPSDMPTPPSNGDAPSDMPTPPSDGEQGDPRQGGFGGGDRGGDGSGMGGNRTGGGRMGGGGGGMQSNTSGYLYINGGTITVDASGDGIDSNSEIHQTGGTVLVSGPTNDGNGALDYDSLYEMTGGTLLAVGSSGMMQSISESSTVQALTTVLNTSSEGGTVEVTDAEGTVLVSFAAEKTFSSVVFADEQLTQGETYTVTVDGEQVAEVTA